jgi:hypothetical protein
LVNVHHFQMIDLELVRPGSVGQMLEKWQIGLAERSLVRRFRNFRTCSRDSSPISGGGIRPRG